MSGRRPKQKLAIPALLAHLAITSVVWRDIARRDPSQLRGSKAIWRALTAMNTGNSLLYLLVGRRR